MLSERFKREDYGNERECNGAGRTYIGWQWHLFSDLGERGCAEAEGCYLVLQSAHTYREGHILRHAALQQAHHYLLGLLPRYYIYVWQSGMRWPNLLDEVRPVDKRRGVEDYDQRRPLFLARGNGLLDGCAAYRLREVVADNLGNQSRQVSLAAINNYLGAIHWSITIMN